MSKMNEILLRCIINQPVYFEKCMLNGWKVAIQEWNLRRLPVNPLVLTKHASVMMVIDYFQEEYHTFHSPMKKVIEYLDET